MDTKSKLGPLLKKTLGSIGIYALPIRSLVRDKTPIDKLLLVYSLLCHSLYRTPFLEIKNMCINEIKWEE